MGSPDQVPHFPPNEMSLIRVRVCRANLPVCFLIRGLDSFAFAREESALRCHSFPPSQILRGFLVACTRDLVMRPYRYHVSLALDRGSALLHSMCAFLSTLSGPQTGPPTSAMLGIGPYWALLGRPAPIVTSSARQY